MKKKQEINLDLYSPLKTLTLEAKGKKRLTILIAGFGYNFDMPIFYYTNKLLDSKETDVLLIDFGYSQYDKYLKLSEEEQEVIFAKDLAIIEEYVESLQYEQLLFIGKSLGTTACYKLLHSDTIYAKTIGVVWLTPGTSAYKISKFIAKNDLNNLLIYGENDKYHEQLNLQLLEQNSSSLTHIPISNADHILESENCVESINILKFVIEKINIFVNKLFIS
ncbi:MAG: hypothetical protein OWP43_10935 [Sphaerochaetaceae bacterium]|nr:hypothetical protein [Sphaerochaetaceae bacterium]